MSLRPKSRLPRIQWIAFGVLLLISVVMMGASGTRIAHSLQTNANLILNPIEGFVSDGVDTAEQFWTTITQLDSMRRKLDELQHENDVLKDEIGRADANSQLYRDYTSAVQAQQDSPYQTILARVVVRDITDIRPKIMILDKGGADGVSVGQVVIDDGGALVGRIIWVERFNAGILLVNDSSATVIGLEAKSGATGTIKGQIGGLLQMSYVNATDTLTKGEAVVTAGLVVAPPTTLLQPLSIKSPYPPGLLIGTIVDVATDPNQVVQSATIRPAANLQGLRYVLIVKNYQGGFYTPAPTTPPSPSPTPKPTVTPRITPEPTLAPGATPTQGLSTPPPY